MLLYCNWVRHLDVLPISCLQSFSAGIRGCAVEIRNLEPHRDYKFRIKVENKLGVSEPSPHITTQRSVFPEAFQAKEQNIRELQTLDDTRLHD